MFVRAFTASIFLGLAGVAIAQSASLQPVFLPENLTRYVSLVSSQGALAVAGTKFNVTTGHELLWWRSGIGTVSLPLPPDTFTGNSLQLVGISSDGRKVVAVVDYDRGPSDRGSQLYRWVDGLRQGPIGVYVAADTVKNAFISPDADTIYFEVINGSSSALKRAFVWKSGTLTRLDQQFAQLSGLWIEIAGLSDDATQFVGSAIETSDGVNMAAAKPFVVKHQLGQWTLEWLPNLESEQTFAVGISRDGRTRGVQHDSEIGVITDGTLQRYSTTGFSDQLFLSSFGGRWAMRAHGQDYVNFGNGRQPLNGVAIGFMRNGQLKGSAGDRDAIWTQGGPVAITDILSAYGLRTDLMLTSSLSDHVGLYSRVSMSYPKLSDPPVLLTTQTIDDEGSRDCYVLRMPSSPAAINDSYNTGAGPSLMIPAPGVLSNDVFSSGSTLVLVTAPQHGTLSLDASGGFTYTPDSGFAGNDSFRYKIVLGPFSSAIAVVTLRVPPEVASHELSVLEVQGGASVRGTVKLRSPAPVGGATVTLVPGGSELVANPTHLSFLEGVKGMGYTLKTLPVDSDRLRTIAASAGGNTRTASLRLLAAKLKSLSFLDSTTAGGYTVKAIASLTGKSGPSGVTVLLVSASANLVPPPSVILGGGLTAVTFRVSTTPVANSVVRTMTATLGAVTKSASVTLLPLDYGVVPSPSVLLEGFKFEVKLSLTTPAPVGGLTIPLTYSSPILIGPPSMTVGAGLSEGSVVVRTSAEKRTPLDTFVVSDIGGVRRKATVRINPVSLGSVALDIPSVVSGTTAYGTVTLDAAAGSDGALVYLQANNGAAIPPSVRVQPGKLTVRFAVETTGAASGSTITVRATRKLVVLSTQLTIR